MRIGKIEVKRRVWVGSASALLVTAAWWGWTRATPPLVVKPAAATAPFVQLVGVGSGRSDEILREQAELFDPTPLFFPTEWNYGQRPLRATMEPQPGHVFESFGAKLSFAEQNMKPYGAETSALPSTLADVLVQGNEAPLAGIGQVDVARAPVSERSGFLEIRRIGEVKFAIEQSLKGLAVPKQDFAPLEFLVVVSSAGVVGEPVLTAGSGWEQVDSFFRTYLVSTFRLGERLNPGRYRVLVGP